MDEAGLSGTLDIRGEEEEWRWSEHRSGRGWWWWFKVEERTCRVQVLNAPKPRAIAYDYNRRPVWPLLSATSVNRSDVRKVSGGLSAEFIPALISLDLLLLKNIAAFEQPWHTQTTQEIHGESRVTDAHLRPVDSSNAVASPWVILSDFGSAFAMGAVGGTIWHGIKGARNSPRVRG